MNYGQENEEWLNKITVAEIEQYMKEGHFAPGSMLPKVEAAVQYVKARPDGKAMITSLEMLARINEEGVGTEIFL